MKNTSKYSLCMATHYKTMMSRRVIVAKIPSRVKYGIGLLRRFNKQLTQRVEDRARQAWNHILDSTPHFHNDRITIILNDIHEMHKRRMYTYTHDDRTGWYSLSAGKAFNLHQLSSPYQRIMRDEVLGEWMYNETTRRYELHVYCRVSGELLLWPAPPTLRSYIFQRDMNLVIESIAYADIDILKPHVDDTDIYVHLRSHVTALHEIISWGILGDRKSWRIGASKAAKDRMTGCVSLMALIYSFLQGLVEQSSTISLCSVC